MRVFLGILIGLGIAVGVAAFYLIALLKSFGRKWG